MAEASVVGKRTAVEVDREMELQGSFSWGTELGESSL